MHIAFIRNRWPLLTSMADGVFTPPGWVCTSANGSEPGGHSTTMSTLVGVPVVTGPLTSCPVPRTLQTVKPTSSRGRGDRTGVCADGARGLANLKRLM